MKAKVHKKITRKALELFLRYSDDAEKTRFEIYRDDIVQGSVEADYFPLSDRATNWHFYKENSLLEPTKIGAIKVYPTSDVILAKRLSQFRENIAMARKLEVLGDDAREDAFEYAGRVLHHIQDTSTPSHVTPIYHGPDFPFNQVDGALIVPDYFEDYTAKSGRLNRLIDLLDLSQEDFEGLRSELPDSVMSLYETAATESLDLLFEDIPTSFIEGVVDGEVTPIPLSMFWQRNEQAPANGRIKGFGTFGPLHRFFANPDQTIEVDGKRYAVSEAALDKLCQTLFEKMLRDSVQALILLAKMIPDADVTLKVESKAPVYGENYNQGYIGFTYKKKSVVSIGIAYITRWSRLSEVMVSHAFVVKNADECIEAVGEGVRIGSIKHYFDDPECQVFFRKPIEYNEDIASRICKTAEKEVGKAYDSNLIPMHFLVGTMVGRAINLMTFKLAEKLVMSFANSENKWICSELAAYSLDEQPEFRDKGVLSEGNETINPQELFEDEVIFKPWRNS